MIPTASNIDDSAQSESGHELMTIGWREYVGLPELGIPSVKAKVDSGARTSALHAFELRSFEENGVQRVEFKIHPRQYNTESVCVCVADVLDERTVTDSGGHKENRFVISTPMTIGAHTWRIEITLTARDDMRFRMLLGRSAIKGRALIDSSRSYLVGKKKRRKKKKRV